MILTDSKYQILNLLRQRTDAQTEEKHAVREIYPVNSATQLKEPVKSVAELEEILADDKPQADQKKKKQKKQTLSRKLNYAFGYGIELIDHFLSQQDPNPTPEQILATIQSAYDFLCDKSVKVSKLIQFLLIKKVSRLYHDCWVDWYKRQFDSFIHWLSPFQVQSNSGFEAARVWQVLTSGW